MRPEPALPRRGARGFTLLETLIAFAIMAAGLAVLIGAFGDGIGGARAAAARLALVEAAQDRLATVGATLPLVPGTREGRDGAIGWRVVIAPAEAVGPPAGPRLYDVTVDVADTSGRRFALTSQRLGR